MLPLLLAVVFGASGGWMASGLGPSDWWLDSPAGVRRVLIATAVSALFCGFLVRALATLLRPDAPEHARLARGLIVVEPLLFLAGALAALVVRWSLLPDAPPATGTNFPPGILAGAGMLTATVGGGWTIGGVLGWALGRAAR